MKNKKFLEKKGITLVALIVTIIVIMILAGVTIGTLYGENGVINKAKKMSETEQQKQENSQILINKMETMLATSEDEITLSKSELNSLIDNKIKIAKQELSDSITSLQNQVTDLSNKNSEQEEIISTLKSQLSETQTNISDFKTSYSADSFLIRGHFSGNADELTTPGAYRTSGSTNCNSNGFLFVFNTNHGDCIMQITCGYNGDNLLYRTKWYGNGWYDWKSF